MWFGRAKPGGGTSCGSGVFWSVGVESILRFGVSMMVWGSNRLDSKNRGLGSRKPQKPGPLGGVGVGCRLRRVIRFYRTLTTVWTCEAKKPRWPKIHLLFVSLYLIALFIYLFCVISFLFHY